MRLWAGIALLASALLLVPSSLAGKDRNLVSAQAFVNKRCPADEREISTGMWIAGAPFNALYGNCRAGDGRDQHAWFFAHGRFVGPDAPSASRDIVGIWRDDRTIAFLYVLYRRSDPECCPTGGGALVRFRWDGRRVVRLDPLPPRAGQPGVRAGR